jgi:hypothetical protein
MLDGKGLVYQKRAGTGSAVYTGPAAQIGANPLDALANQIRVEGKYKIAEAAQKKANNLKTLAVDLEGWDYDNKRYFAQMEDQLKREGAALATAGKDLNNFADEQVADWSKKVDKWKKAALASTNQGKMYQALVDTAAKDPNKYDLEATMAGAKQYMELTPEQRLQQDPQKLLVYRYDPYGPIEDLKVDDFGSKNEWRGLSRFGSSETLRTKQLRNEINSRVENPESMRYYEYNKDKYGWKDLQDYKEFLYQYKKNQFVADSKSGVLDAGNTYGWGFDQYLDSATNSSPVTINTATSIYTGGSSPDKTQDIKLWNAQGVNSVSLVIPGKEAISLKKNAKGAGSAKMQGNYEINNANMGIALMRTDNSQLLPSNTVEFNFADSEGKEVKYTSQQAFEKGLVKYVPVIQGNGKYVNEAGIALYEPIVAEANRFITPDMAQRSAAENDAYQKLLALNTLTDQYNKNTLMQSPQTSNKLTFVEWKKQNPNGTAAEYAKYKQQ